MTSVLVIGSGGMLGQDLMSELQEFSTQGLSRADLDITHPKQVAQAVRDFDVVVNTAAYTQVDDAESKPEIAYLVNTEGARNVAEAARDVGARLIHLSTDYVFDGKPTKPFGETSPARPASVYGQSKRDGERAVLETIPESSIILRTSWLYGEHGPNFASTMAKIGRTQETINVVNDQTGQPTWTVDVARLIRSLIADGPRAGIFHATNSGHTTWWEFARYLFELAGWDPDRVRPISSDSLARPAVRPRWSVLGHDNWHKFNLEEPRHWRAAIGEAWETYLSDEFREPSHS